MSSIRWKKFFTESGLPSEVCENYAVIFSENRIRFDMLEELNKEILYDMGIKKLGDVISILRHAKEVHSNSFRERVFAKDEGGNGSSKQDNNSTYTKADSTITTDKLKKPAAGESRRVILPQQSARQETKVVAANDAVPSRGPPMRVVRRTAQATTEEPVVIRNLSGIRPVALTGRNVTGLDPIDPPVTINRKRIEPPFEMEVDTSARKVAKTDLIINPTVRNRIEAQSRLSNFSKEIQKVISSNSSSSKPLPPLTPQPTQTTVITTTPASVKSRLTLNQAPDSTTITINRNTTARRNISVKARLGIPGATASLSASPAASTIKDRLGKKSVFSRVSLTTSSNGSGNIRSSSSVFKRLGV